MRKWSSATTNAKKEPVLPEEWKEFRKEEVNPTSLVEEEEEKSVFDDLDKTVRPTTPKKKEEKEEKPAKDVKPKSRIVKKQTLKQILFPRVRTNLPKDQTEMEEVKRSKEVSRVASEIAGVFEVRPAFPVSEEFADLAFFLHANLTPLRLWVPIIMVLLSFFEKPWWCHSSEEDCNMDHVFLNSTIPKLSSIITDSIQLCCLVIIGAGMCLHIFFHGKQVHKRLLNTYVQLALVVFSFIDTIISMFWHAYKAHVFLSPFIRPVLLVMMNKNLKRTFVKLMKLIPATIELVFSMFFIIIIFSWFGLLLFNQEDRRDEFDDQKYFSTFYDAFTSMLILLTASNNPDVRLPYYDQNRFSVLFFIIYLLIQMYFLSPFVFGVICNEFKDVVVDERKRKRKKKMMMLTSLFEKLDKERTGYLTHETCEILISELGAYSSVISRMPEGKINLLLTSLEDSEGRMNKDQFMSLCSIIQLDFIFDDHRHQERKSKNLWTQVGHVFSYNSCHQLDFGGLRPALASMVNHKYFEYVVDLLVLVNALLLAIMTLFILNAKNNDVDDYGTIWNSLEFVFSVIFLMEMLLKLYVWGFTKYIKQIRNVIDGVITITSGVVTVVALATHAVDVKMVVVIRSIRLFRLIGNFRRFRIIFKTLLKLLPVFSALFGVMFAVFITFGLAGLRFYGGLLHLDEPLLQNTSYAQSNYYHENFNDLGNACLVCFDLMSVNNWYVTMEAIVKVTSQWSVLFFIAFWFFSNLLTLNLFIANLLDIVLDEFSKKKRKERQSGMNVDAWTPFAKSSGPGDPPGDGSKGGKMLTVVKEVIRRNRINRDGNELTERLIGSQDEPAVDVQEEVTKQPSPRGAPEQLNKEAEDKRKGLEKKESKVELERDSGESIPALSSSQVRLRKRKEKRKEEEEEEDEYEKMTRDMIDLIDSKFSFKERVSIKKRSSDFLVQDDDDDSSDDQRQESDDEEQLQREQEGK